MRRHTTEEQPGHFTSYKEAVSYYAIGRSDQYLSDVVTEHLREKGQIVVIFEDDDGKKHRDAFGKRRPKWVGPKQIANYRRGRSLPSYKVHLALGWALRLKGDGWEEEGWKEFDELFRAALAQRHFDQAS